MSRPVDSKSSSSGGEEDLSRLREKEEGEGEVVDGGVSIPVGGREVTK